MHVTYSRKVQPYGNSLLHAEGFRRLTGGSLLGVLAYWRTGGQVASVLALKYPYSENALFSGINGKNGKAICETLH